MNKRGFKETRTLTPFLAAGFESTVSTNSTMKPNIVTPTGLEPVNTEPKSVVLPITLRGNI